MSRTTATPFAPDAATFAGQPTGTFSGVDAFSDYPENSPNMAKVEAIRGWDAGRLYRSFLGLDPIPVQSTNVATIAYDETQHFLFVRFKSGGLYAYDVPAMVFVGMNTAGSKGKYVWDVLRGADGQRPVRMLDLDHRFNYVKIE